MKNIQLEPIIKNPLIIKMSHMGSFILGDSVNPDYALTPGAMIGGESYGFTLIVDVDGKQTEKTYGTHTPIDAVGYDTEGVYKDHLNIKERHKYVSWLFDKKGKLVRKAEFLNVSRRDVDYVQKNYGMSVEAFNELSK